jgi:hypothetical protein
MLFARYLEREIRLAELEEEWFAPARRLVPFAEELFELEESLLAMDFVSGQKAAGRIHKLAKAATATKDDFDGSDYAPHEILAAAEVLGDSTKALDRWHSFYHGYDPEFDWWVSAPYQALQESIDALKTHLNDFVTKGNADLIVGKPVGRERLLEDLGYERIPYSPEELIAIAEEQYAWCQARIQEASKQLGFGDDWRAAQEHVKGMHEKPGSQPAAIKRLALEGIEFVESRGLVTVPELAKETIHMSMMSAEHQKVNPFFLGGKRIIVSYPTSAMSHEEKLMSMRGNNTPFSHATVQHELIPGHHLQWFMEARNKPYRQLFATPFWIEGWTLHWEMLLWDLGFPRSAAEEIGMLFWRRHRCVRVVFSLQFHLGQISAQDCVEMLVERVGHERANAEGEVRRSVGSSYSPLYQLAYLIGGLQFRSLYFELVKGGRMTDKEFHDGIMAENNIPPYTMRSLLRGDEITQDYGPEWRFADTLPRPKKRLTSRSARIGRQRIRRGHLPCTDVRGMPGRRSTLSFSGSCLWGTGRQPILRKGWPTASLAFAYSLSFTTRTPDTEPDALSAAASTLTVTLVLPLVSLVGMP